MIFLELFYTFFTIGLFTFGGGYAMLPLIQERVVANGWMEVSQIMDFIAVSESTPGPFAINIATYVGTQMGGAFGAEHFGAYGTQVGGVLGGVCATLGVVLPSFIVILLVARWYEKFKASRLVAGAMTGLRPVVIGLIGSAVLSMVLEVFFSAGITLAAVTGYWFIASLIIAAVALALMFAVKAHPVVLILVSAALGIGAGYLEPLIVK